MRASNFRTAALKVVNRQFPEMTQVPARDFPMVTARLFEFNRHVNLGSFRFEREAGFRVHGNAPRQPVETSGFLGLAFLGVKS
jgi:hypothetical protein